jgi:hypothetical protein
MGDELRRRSIENDRRLHSVDPQEIVLRRILAPEVKPVSINGGV